MSWRPMSDLPLKKGEVVNYATVEVLVTDGETVTSTDATAGTGNHEGFWFAWQERQNMPSSDKWIAWMPMPEPPK